MAVRKSAKGDQPPSVSSSTSQPSRSAAFPNPEDTTDDISALDLDDSALLQSLNLGDSGNRETADGQVLPHQLDTSNEDAWLEEDANAVEGRANTHRGLDQKLGRDSEIGKPDDTTGVGPIGAFLEDDDDDDIDDISTLVGNRPYDKNSTNPDELTHLDDQESIPEEQDEHKNLDEEVAALVGEDVIVGDEEDANDQADISKLVDEDEFVESDSEEPDINPLAANGAFFDDEDEDDDDDSDDPSVVDQSTYDSDAERNSPNRSHGFRPSSGRAALVDEPDENDDSDDDKDVLDPIEEELGFEGPLGDDDDEDEDEAAEGEDDVIADADAGADEFDAESEEDIQSAADILSDRGLLGLGVEKSGRRDASSVKKFALADEEDEDEEEFEEPSVVGEALGLSNMIEDEDVNDEDGDVIADDDDDHDIDDYPDMEDDDDDLGLTSQASFGRVWELNEDTYVTITEPGESFGYELDEEDQEDQDMSTMRRGKQGGWSGGLASYPASDLPEGSREWIARRSYELMMKASPSDMYRWTRRHLEPPAEIAALYPDDPPPTTPLGKTTLHMSAPPAAVSMIGKYDGSSGDFDTSDFEGDDAEEEIEEEVVARVEEHALDRSVKFPCQYKFKVEGDVDDEFVRSIRETTENMLERRIPRSAFSCEPAGRYQRVTIVVEVNSAKQVTELYDALRNNSGVKFSYG